MTHFVAKQLQRVPCGMCVRAGRGQVAATHRVAEVILSDDPDPKRHELAQCVCCTCFMSIVGGHNRLFSGCPAVAPAEPTAPAAVPVEGA